MSAGTVCPAYLLPFSRQNLSRRLAVRRRSKIFSSPNGFKIFKVPIPWAFAFGLDIREFRGGCKLYRRGDDGRRRRSDTSGFPKFREIFWKRFDDPAAELGESNPNHFCYLRRNI